MEFCIRKLNRKVKNHWFNCIRKELQWYVSRFYAKTIIITIKIRTIGLLGVQTINWKLNRNI